MRAADLIVRSLVQHGIQRLYCVAGESYLTLLDALAGENAIHTVTCRHESGAGFMAVAEAKLTGRPAVFAVSRGPGATNGSIALHVADQDATPIIMLIGQVSREERGRGAFQEIDYTSFFGSIAKAVWEIHDGDRLAETLARAFHLAQSGTPGPVVIALPEDMLKDETTTPLPAPFPLTPTLPSLEQAGTVVERLAAATQPLIIAGGAMRSEAGTAALKQLAERHRVPVALTWKNQDLFDNNSPLYAGHLGFGSPPALKEQLSRADLIVALGTRLGDVASLHYTLPAAPEPRQPLIHIYPDPDIIGRNFRTDIGLACDPVAFAAMCAGFEASIPEGREQWLGEIAEFISGFMTFAPVGTNDGGIDFGVVVTEVARQVEKDAIVITDAGNFSTWVHRHWKLTPKNRLLGAIGGAMGFAVPAGVAAGLVAPHRQIIAFVGDGGALMTGNELATALQLGVAPKIFISDNSSYGTIRTHQERMYPQRVVATKLKNPDFEAWGRSFGAAAYTIGPGDDVAAIVRSALGHDGAAVVRTRSSLEALSAFTTLSALTDM